MPKIDITKTELVWPGKLELPRSRGHQDACAAFDAARAISVPSPRFREG